MKSIVIKCGGSVMDELDPQFFESLKELQNAGYQLIFVHGGGPDINKMLELYQIPPQFVNGLRKTTSDVMEVAEMVLAGQANRKLTALLDSHGFKAFGVNGSDGKLFRGEFINKEKLGLVGDITDVKTEVLNMLFREKFVPVITPIAVTEDGTKLNVNADFAAAAAASALQAEQCIFVTDVNGIIIDGELSHALDTEEIEQHIREGKITGGMIPKVTSAAAAIGKGLQSVMIVSGKSKFFDGSKWKGTKICAKEEVLR